MSLKYSLCFIYKVTRLQLCRLGELNALHKRVKYTATCRLSEKTPTFLWLVCSIG